MAKSKRAKSAPPKSTVVDTYVSRLKKSGLESEEFESVLADLVADKTAQKPELNSIASQYVGVPLASSSRNVALREIEKKFIELVRSQRKREVASKGTPS